MATDNQSRLVSIGLIFILFGGIIAFRLAYLQIIRHDYFAVLANQTHLRKFEIPAKRGRIFMHDRGQVVPVAMNRNLKTLYADTRYIYNESGVLRELRDILGTDYSNKLGNAEGYVVLDKEIEFEIARQIDRLELSGIGLSDNYVRVYPEGTLGAQLLGFVNHDGEGQYGMEGFFDDVLTGKPGLFDVETDVRGIPIATADNIQLEPSHGSDVVLTVDRNVQARVEAALENGVETMKADGAHAVILNPNSGAVLAMASYPSYDPNNYHQVSDYSLFENVPVGQLFEPGSGFKMFTMAAGLETGAVMPEETYYDAGSVRIADRTISNAEGGNLMRTMTDVITYSVNTGVIYVLQQLGGGGINLQAKETLYDFFVDRFKLTSATGIEQPAEPKFYMNRPEEVGPVNYASMTFGQGIATTMVRMTASMTALINGGTLYAPYMVDYRIAPDGIVSRTVPSTIAENVVSSQTSEQLREMMETVVLSGGGFGTRIKGYRIGGKTGTAQVPHPQGGYYIDRDIGSFIGFAPLDSPQYIMMVRVDNPSVPGYAGSAAAGPIFGEIMEWLLQYGGVPPDGQ